MVSLKISRNAKTIHEREYEVVRISPSGLEFLDSVD